MPVIDPQGLFDGERLAACSDQAKFCWPYIYCASNGYARLEVNLKAIRQKCFSSFEYAPDDSDLTSVLKEYAENYLLILYEFQGRQWVQFDTSAKYLPRHKSKKDEASPLPPPESVKSFTKGYIEWKRTKSPCLQHSRKLYESCGTFPQNVRGIGIGIGVGDGVGVGVDEPQNQPISPENGREDDVKIKQEITAVCYEFDLGAPESYANIWQEMVALERGTSRGSVVNEFRVWAQQNQGDDFRGKPVSAYLRSRQSGGIQTQKAASDPMVINLVRELAYRSDGAITFDDKAKAGLAAEIARGNTPDEIVAVFKRDFLPKVLADEFKMKRAGPLFVQEVDQLVSTARRKGQEKAQEAQVVAEAKERLETQAAAEREARRAAQTQEADAVEETLGGAE